MSELESSLVNLTVKDVDLFGDTIVAALDKDGMIWAGVRWICDGLGLSEGQVKSERKKIQEDLVISQGTKFHPLGKDNANSDVLCLQLDYIPLWLAKISITPNMKKNNPELVEKLIKYQLKAKDVLAAAFLPEKCTGVSNKIKNKHGHLKEPVQQFINKPNALDFHNTPVITTSELSKHYGIPYQNILTTFYRHRDYFEKDIHYFLLEMDEEVEFRAMNGLNTSTKLYLWTKKGSLMFTKVINNEVGWNQYKRILDILFEVTYGQEENTGIGSNSKNSKNTEVKTQEMQYPILADKQLKTQSNWFLKNAYKIERICNALDMSVKEFNHLIIAKIQEKYDMEHIGATYKCKIGKSPEYALDIIGCFPELSEVADDMLFEYMLSVIDRYTLMKSIAMK